MTTELELRRTELLRDAEVRRSAGSRRVRNGLKVIGSSVVGCIVIGMYTCGGVFGAFALMTLALVISGLVVTASGARAVRAARRDLAPNLPAARALPPRAP